jgi:uncharacterized membrane protein YoaK (UPF0700 family)
MQRLLLLAFEVLLIIVAGFVDAVGFLNLGHLFVSFMSGNSTQLAIGLERGSWTEIAPAGGIVILFTAGVVIGSLLMASNRHRRRPLVLGGEAILLVVSASISAEKAIEIAAMAFAMGMQNAILRTGDFATSSRTYVTGTLVHFGETLADAVVSQASPKLCLSYLSLWLGLLLGGGLGAWAFAEFGIGALFAPAAILFALSALAVTPALNRHPSG